MTEHMIKGVELPSIRSELIMVILDLQDQGYQEQVWLKVFNHNHGFHENIMLAFDFLIEERVLGSFVEMQKYPYELINVYLKNKKEAELLYRVVELIRPMCWVCYYDTDYLTSHYLAPMRKVAKLAFEEFIKNEADNKEFMEFVDWAKATMEEEKKDPRKYAEKYGIR